jgi:hypothetical protein
LPTIETRLQRTFVGAGPDQAASLVAPELIYLPWPNHLAIKAALPIGLAGPTDYGVLAAIEYER